MYKSYQQMKLKAVNVWATRIGGVIKHDVNHRAGDVLDKIERFYSPSFSTDSKLVDNVFVEGNAFFAFEFRGISKDEVFVLASKCELKGLTQKEGIEIVKRGLQIADNELEDCQNVNN